MIHRFGFRLVGIIGLMAGCMTAFGASVGYPDRPVRVIVPYPAGGIGDAWARAVTGHLSRKWGQPLVIEARPGASSIIGTNLARSSKADGYTWLFVASALFTAPAMIAEANWHPVDDFDGVGVIGYAPVVFVTGADVPVRTLGELLDMAKRRPGEVTAGVVNTSTNHFVLEALMQEAGVRFLPVPYNGAPPIVADLAAGNVQFSALPVSVALPMIRSGRIRPLAIAALQRHPLLPEVPTYAESGLVEKPIVAWYGIALPKGTPDAVLRRINEDFNAALEAPEVVESLRNLGGDAPSAMRLADIRNLMASDFRKYSELIRRGTIKAR